MVTPDSFRALYPEFSSTVSFTDPTINAWIPIASRLVNPARWGELTDFGVSLNLAHRLTLMARNAKAAERNKPAGVSTGLVASKSVDGASISFDHSTASEEGAGWYNLTTYGQEFYRMSQMMGAGPLQVGADPTGANVSSYFWPGVTPPQF